MGISHFHRSDIWTKNSLKIEVLFVFVILLSGFLIRWNDLDRTPYGIENDEYGLMITSLLHNYQINAGDKGLWSMHDHNAKLFPVPNKLIQVSYSIFGKDFLSPRKILAIYSILSLLLLYIYSRNFLPSSISFLVTLLYSFSVYKLIIGRVVLQSGFVDLFPLLTWTLIAFTKYCSVKNNYFVYLLVLLASLTTFLSIASYNINYLVPLISTLTLLFFIHKRFHLKQILIISLLFLLPLSAMSPKIFQEIKLEMAAKKYATGNTFAEFKNLSGIQNKLLKNSQAVYSQLFTKLQYNTKDMLVSYSQPLVPKAITFLAITGFVFSLIKIKEYFPILIWFTLQFGVYQLILGLYLPRMWVLTTSAIYLLFGIGIYNIYKILASRNKVSLAIFSILLLGLSIYTLLTDYRIYNVEALNNSSYKTYNREILEINKEYKSLIGQKLIFVFPSEFDANWGNAGSSFYYLINNPEKSNYLKKQGRKSLGLLTISDFNKNMNNYLNSEIIIVDNKVVDSVRKDLDKVCSCKYKTDKYQNFTEIEPLLEKI